MPEDLYADAAPAATPDESQPEDTASDSQTAELPKAVLGGKEFKPGDEVVLKITQVLENSVIVQYASESGEEEKEEPAAAPAPTSAPNSMSAMME